MKKSNVVLFGTVIEIDVEARDIILLSETDGGQVENKIHLWKTFEDSGKEAHRGRLVWKGVLKEGDLITVHGWCGNNNRIIAGSFQLHSSLNQAFVCGVVAEKQDETTYTILCQTPMGRAVKASVVSVGEELEIGETYTLKGYMNGGVLYITDEPTIYSNPYDASEEGDGYYA